MTSFIKLNDIHFSYDNLNSEIIAGITASFHSGWTSICGVNGCGKSTLLALLAQHQSPDSGSVQIKGKVSLVSQSTELPPPNPKDFLESFNPRKQKLKQKFGIQNHWPDQWSTLSIGERKRFQIASALSEEPDILLIDEPSNHLDANAKQVILEMLKEFSGIGMIVTHDRLLLNELCNNTAFLEAGKLQIFSVPYDLAKEELRATYSSAQQERDKLKKEWKRLTVAAHTQTEIIAQGKAKLSKRGLSNKDHDAKERINRAKLFGADRSDSNKKRSFSKRASKLQQEMARIRTPKQYNLGVFFENTPNVKPIHLEKRDWTFDFLSIKQPEITLKKGDKLAITGNNGVGKSTLLQAWLKELNVPYIYGPQELDKANIEAHQDQLAQLDSESRGKIMTLVSCLGSSPKSLLAGSLPSPGVWQKLIVAIAIVKAAPMLILDEPTNHMDLDAIEVLEDALQKYQGVLIVISHDENFVRKVCNMRLHLTNNRELRSSEACLY